MLVYLSAYEGSKEGRDKAKLLTHEYKTKQYKDKTNQRLKDKQGKIERDGQTKSQLTYLLYGPLWSAVRARCTQA